MFVSIRWKFEIISKLVGISEAIRLILVFIELNLFYSISKLFILEKHVFQAQTIKIPDLSLLKSTNNKYCLMLSRKMSTTIKNLDKSNNTKDLKYLAFKEWLAGLIDGDGSFLLSKKGYASLEITMDIRDEHPLQLIKNVYGGSIKLRSGANALR